jgi:hypothetical protein
MTAMISHAAADILLILHRPTSQDGSTVSKGSFNQSSQIVDILSPFEPPLADRRFT